MLSCENFKIFKNTYFENLQTAASGRTYILHKKLNKIVQKPDWPFISFWNIKSLHFTYCYLFWFVLSLAVIRCHSLPFFVTRCHSLAVPLVVTRCHSLSLVVIRCHSLCHSVSLVVTGTPCTTRLSVYKTIFSWVIFLETSSEATIHRCSSK